MRTVQRQPKTLLQNGKWHEFVLTVHRLRYVSSSPWHQNFFLFSVPNFYNACFDPNRSNRSANLRETWQASPACCTKQRCLLPCFKMNAQLAGNLTF